MLHKVPCRTRLSIITIWNISNCALVVTCSDSSWGRKAVHDCPLISTRACLVSRPRVITLAIKTALWGAALLRAQGRVPSELPFTQNQQIKQYGEILNFISLSEQGSPLHTANGQVCKHRQVKQPLFCAVWHFVKLIAFFLSGIWLLQ